ncbi:CopG family transcriptional regulator [Dactylosporangium sp. NPDC005572]|uniref:ribbon-helix-helix domain-containing protein n=1 Tax=Dactylosporangium sp. NPDC005572 TaxID=3156889 RepID=UPI0033A9F9CE
MSDNFDLQSLAETERIGREHAAGELDLQPVTDPAEAARLLATMPPPGAPVSVVESVRLPYDVDEAIRKVAAARGVSVSAMIREWIVKGLAEADDAPDPLAELRHLGAAVQRVADRLASREHRDAA